MAEQIKTDYSNINEGIPTQGKFQIYLNNLLCNAEFKIESGNVLVKSPQGNIDFISYPRALELFRNYKLSIQQNYFSPNDSLHPFEVNTIALDEDEGFTDL